MQPSFIICSSTKLMEHNLELLSDNLFSKPNLQKEKKRKKKKKKTLSSFLFIHVKVLDTSSKSPFSLKNKTFKLMMPLNQIFLKQLIVKEFLVLEQLFPIEEMHTKTI